MAKQAAQEDIENKPITTRGILAASYGVGSARINGIAERLGIKPKRMRNGRDLFTIAQVRQIAREIEQ